MAPFPRLHFRWHSAPDIGTGRLGRASHRSSGTPFVVREKDDCRRAPGLETREARLPGMKVVALICARGGSKGLPNKNILPLAGRPLVARAVDHARSVERVSRVIVSTESADIAAIARDAGAEVPFVRPAELAGDAGSEWLVWRHALAFLEESDGAYPDALLVLPPTAPLRAVTDIQLC